MQNAVFISFFPKAGNINSLNLLVFFFVFFVVIFNLDYISFIILEIRWELRKILRYFSCFSKRALYFNPSLEQSQWEGSHEVSPHKFYGEIKEFYPCYPFLSRALLFSYPNCWYIWLWTFVSQCFGTDCNISQEPVWSLHGNHLNNPPLVQVSIETGVPFWVNGFLTLNQLDTSSWNKNNTELILVSDTFTSILTRGRLFKTNDGVS